MTGEPTGDAAVRRHPMRTRWSGPLAIALGVAMLVWWAWRAVPIVPAEGSARAVTVGITLTTLLVQIAAVAATTALLVALRRTRLPRASRRRVVPAEPVEDPAADPVVDPGADRLGPLDVVVRFDAQPIGHLHATLAGVRHLFDVHHIVVVTDRVDEVTRAVRGTGTAVVIADASDTTRLRAAAHLGAAPFVAVFDAGDVPRPGFTGVVRGPFVDPSVAVVQGCATVDGIDSAEHDARGHHELRFEREVLNPALGARGHAVLLGSGAIVRRSVLRSVPVPRGARRSAELRWSIAVSAAGHQLCAPYEPIVSAASSNTECAVTVERRRSVRAAMATLTSRHSPLWTRRLPGSARVGYAAWMVRPLSGWRRLCFVAVLLAAVATGVSPVRPGASAAVLAALCAGWFVAQGWSVGRASYGVLRPGDRTRWSLRIMGASIAATFGAGRAPVGAAIDDPRIGGWRDARRNPVLTVVLVLVAAASVAMGIDRWVPVLPVVDLAGVSTEGSTESSPWAPVVASAIAVWCVALILDVLRCLVGGPQLRAAQRLRVRLEATIDEVPARITNLSPRGAGIRFGDREPDLIEGDEVAMRFLVPTGSGTTAEVATIATVRALRIDEVDGMSQLVGGVEFGTMDRISADALFAYCAVVHPARLADADEAERRRAAELVAGPLTPQRFAGARLVGAVALLGIGSAMMPPYGVTTAAGGSPERSITVRVVDDSGAGVPGAMVAASCVQAVRVHGSDTDDGWPSVAELVRSADDALRAQQRDRVAARTADLAARDLRREMTPSPQLDQLRRQRAAEAALAPFVPKAAPVSGWLPVPAVDTVVGEPVLLADRGDGSYTIDDLAGWPCRVELATLPPGYVAGPITPSAGAGVQFADGGDVLRMAVVPAPAVADDATSAAGATAVEPLIEIGDRVWIDVDADGVQDPGEPGAPGVTVTLTADGSTHAVVTGADGEYRFTNGTSPSSEAHVASGINALRSGATVQVQVPITTSRGVSTFHLTVAGAASGSAVDPASGATTFVVEAPAAASTVVRHDLDVGYAQAHAIGDRVWLDADNDGRMGAGEQGVDGVTVALYVDAAGDGEPDGAAVAAQVTGQGGLYAFGGLPAGTYVIDVFPPAGMVSSTGATARLDGPFEPPTPGQSDDDADDGRLLANGVIRSAPVTVGVAGSPLGEPGQPSTAAGDTMAAVPDARGDATVDFGLFPSRAIDDGLWFDQNGDGLLSPGEPGLGGVPISLMRGDEVLAATVTDAAGDFLFPNLTLGDYELHIGAPAGLHPVDTLPRPDGELDEAPSPDADASGAADADGDGVPDLIDETPDALATDDAVTDAVLDALDGTIDGVFNGIVQDAGGGAAAPEAPEFATSEPDGPAALRAPEILPTAPAPTDDPAVEVVAVTVAPDWAGLAADRALQRFGLWAPRSIGHRVWEDADDDGVFDTGEVGIPGIEVRLVRGVELVATTVSAVDGTYRFNDLPDGTYRVVIDVPTTWRTAQVGWDQPVGARSGIDHGSSRRAAGRAVSPPIRLGRLTTDDLTTDGSFDRVGIGLFQPRPAVTLEASLRGCSARTATGTTGPRGSCTAGGTDDANPIVTSGAELTWVYVATNTGNTPLNDMVVTDDLDPTLTVDCNGVLGGDGQPFRLEPGRAATCTLRDRVTAGQGRRTATLVATGETAPNDDSALEPVTATTNWFATAPGLTLSTGVMVSPPGVDADGDGVLDVAPPDDLFDAAVDADVAEQAVADGAPVWWVYDVSNTSTDVIADVAVVDAERGRVCADVVLAPGEHRWCVVAGIAAGAGTIVRATATATGTDVSDPTVQVPVAPTSDTAAVRVARPELVVEAAVDGGEVATVPTFTATGGPGAAPAPVTVTAGRSVELTYTVANTGDTTFSTVVLVDSTAGLLDCAELSVGHGGLEPGERVSCTMRRPLASPSSGGASTPVTTVVRAEAQAVSDPLQPVIVEERWAYVATTVSASATVRAAVTDAPVSGVPVRLLDERGEVVATTTTDLDGSWRVTGLSPGRFSAQYVVPDGYRAELAGELLEPSADGTAVTSIATIEPIEPGTETVATPDWDLELVRPSAVANAVWVDGDGDGRRDAAERGLDGAVVTLTGADGSVVAVTTTAADGRWWFDGVLPGHDRVTVHAPVGHQVWRGDASDGAAAVTVDAANGPAVWVTATDSVSGRVWDDDDGNGWLVPGDRGAPNVVVTLVEVVSGVAHPVAVTATDNIGRFSFAGLPHVAERELVLGRVVDGTDATTLASWSPPTPAAPASDGDQADALVPVRPADAFDVHGTRLALADDDGATTADIALSVSPLTRAVVAPGRPAPDHSFFLSTADLVPTTAVEAVQAAVFVLSLVVFSTVIATMRRRRLR